MALEDSFAALPAHLQQSWASSAPQQTVEELLAGALGVLACSQRVALIHSLCARDVAVPELAKPLEVTVSLHVRLVGFDGDGDGAVSTGPADWAPFLDALRLEVDAHDLSRGENGTLVRERTQCPPRVSLCAYLPLSAAQPLRTLFHVTVSSAPAALAAQLSSAVRGGVQSEGSTVALVPHAQTEALVAADHRASSAASYTLYLLNPTAPPVPYAYSYPGGGCPGTLWVGRARYAWVDLGAGPVAYGPRVAGLLRHGVTTPHDFPRPASFARRADKPALVAALLGLVRSAAAHLLSPPMAHAPAMLWRHTQVAVVRITDVMVAASESGANARAVEGLDLEVLRRELLGAQLGTSGVSATLKELSLGACDLCGVALAAAMRALPGGGGGNSSFERQYVDSKSLHGWLVKLLPALSDSGTLRLQEGMAGGSSSRVLPVLLFDLARTDALLLDGEHVAVAFPDMVLALRTRAAQHAPAGAVCAAGPHAEAAAFGSGGSDQSVPLAPPVTLDARALTRPLLAACLLSGWSVAPPFRGWSDASWSFSSDHRWDVGQSPFGPLSRSVSLPFSLRDAAQRHAAVWAASEALQRCLGALEGLAQLPGASAALSGHTARAVRTRVEVMRHKLARAGAALAVHGFDAAAYYARSAQHDARAAEAALLAAAAQMQVHLDCQQQAGPGSRAAGGQLSASATGVVAVLALLLFWALRGGSRRRKQF